MSKITKKAVEIINGLDDDSLEAVLPLLEKLAEAQDSEPSDEGEDEEVVAPRKSRLRASKASNDDDEKPAKKTAKKVAAKPAVKKAAAPATDDYSSMKIDELKELADKIGLDGRKAKLKTAAQYAEMLEEIDTLASKKSPEYFAKLATKAKVEVTQPRGRSSDEKKSKVIIAHLINAGHSPL